MPRASGRSKAEGLIRARARCTGLELAPRPRPLPPPRHRPPLGTSRLHRLATRDSRRRIAVGLPTLLPSYLLPPSTSAATPIPAADLVRARARDHLHSTPATAPVIPLPPCPTCSVRLVRNRGSGEGRPWVPHSVEYGDLSTPHTSARQRYVSATVRSL